MRIALLLTDSYAPRSEPGFRASAQHDLKLMRDKLAQPGFEFTVVEMPIATDLSQWITRSLRERSVGPDDSVLVYVSAMSHVDPAGEISVDVDRGVPGASGSEAAQHVPLRWIADALNDSAVRAAVVMLDLVVEGNVESSEGIEHVSAARRVFAPEASGLSMLCAARTTEQASRSPKAPSPFAALLVHTLDRAETRNAAGAITVTRLIDRMREDPDLYTDVPCFALVMGKRDIALYSVVASELVASVPPPAQRASSPLDMRPTVDVVGLLAGAEMHFARKEWDAATEKYKRALLLLGEEKSPRRAEIYMRLADIRIAQHRPREAVIHYQKVLTVLPDHSEARSSMADTLSALGDYAEAATQRRVLLQDCRDDDRRVAWLLALASDCQRANDMRSVVQALETARSLRPEDVVLLGRLAGAYEVTHALASVVEVKVAIANVAREPAQMARLLAEAADYARERVLLPERAREIYDEALDADPFHRRALDSIVGMLSKQGDYPAIENELLGQVRRFEAAHADSAQADVWRTIGELRESRLGDRVGAIEAFDQRLTLLPNDIETRVMLAELLAGVGQTGAAIQSLQIAAFQDPTRLSTYHRLHQLFVKAGVIDQAYLAAAALVQLGDADMDEELFWSQYHPTQGARPTRSMDETGWKDLYPAHHDSLVRTIFRIVAAPAVDFKVARLKERRMLAKPDPAARQDPKTSTVTLTRAFLWASNILGIPLPEIYVADDVPGGIAAVAAETPTAFVGRSLLSGKTFTELAFLTARDLTYYRPEHYVLVLYPTLEELTNLLVAAVRTVHTDFTLPDTSRAEINELSSAIREQLDEASNDELSEVVRRFDATGGRANLVGWAHTIELTATRIGLLLCGDIAVAGAILSKDERGTEKLTPADRMNDLLPFMVSDAYAGLRRQLGMAVAED